MSRLAAVPDEAGPEEGRRSLAWTIADAATGVMERGQVDVRQLVDLQPWPTGGGE